MATGVEIDMAVETLIVGAGAAGMVAALAVRETGREVMVLERDPVPAGSTALSAGLIPAAGTRFQRPAGIEDTPDLFAADIMKKASGEPDPALVSLLAREAATTIEWLADRFGLPFSLVDDFDYPGHARRRMHGLPSRSGAELVDRLRAACESAGVDLVYGRRADRLHADKAGRVTALAVEAPDGGQEVIGCGRLILACNGFGANPDLVRAHMPEIGDAIYFGHPGNCGEALDWGIALGAATRHLGAYQGHGNVAHPHGILITWATITEGGMQVNAAGRRFWNEAQGYSEAARAVLAEPGGTAVTVFDHRIAGIARQFADFQAAEAAGAVRSGETLDDIAAIFGLPSQSLAGEVAAIADAIGLGGSDRYGRAWAKVAPLSPPYCGVRVTGALFHTQGGLVVDQSARVLRPDGSALPNLFAAGGAACGVSGSGDAGYLSGNGLLSAVVLGRLAGLAGGAL